MNYAYIIENTDNNNYRDHSAIFSLISDLYISEDDIYIDTEDSKEELNNLLEILESNDRVIIRSVIDLSEDAKRLLEVLQVLENNEVVLCSIEESFLNGTDYYTAMKGFGRINRYYLDKRREKGFEKAKEDGKVGRPPKKSEDISRAIRLYNTKCFTVEEIQKLSGISSSTLYRALKEIDKET